MVLGVGASAAPHGSSLPVVHIDPQTYRDPDLTDSDRAELEALAAELRKPDRQTEYGDATHLAPTSMRLTTTLRYADDVADFETKWHSYRHELQMRHAREQTARDWVDIRSRLSGEAGTKIDDVDARAQYLEDIDTLAAVARIFADDGDHASFAQVAFYLADLLEMETNDPLVSMLAWATRARLLYAASRLSGTTVPLIGTELRRSLTQYSAVASKLSGDTLSLTLRATADDWLDIAADVFDEAGTLLLADFLADASSRAGGGSRVAVAVAQSLAGRHETATAQFQAAMAEAVRTHPNTRLEVDKRVENAWATSRFLAACRDDDACRQEYGPFAQWIHADVARLRPDVFGHDEPDGIDLATEVGIGPLAFSDPETHLVVLWAGLEGGDWAGVMMHEIQHLQRRAGQVLQTDDGRWLLARRDVPVAAAETYLRTLWNGDDADEEPQTVGSGGGRIAPAALVQLVDRGAMWARRNSSEAGRQIQNMLDHFGALHTQEPASSYPCAAILLGMATTLLAESGPHGVEAYLSHLTVMDHAEALQYGRRHASLRL